MCAQLYKAVCLTDADHAAANLTGEAFVDRFQREPLFLVPPDD
jgi:hypothetical protein